MPAADGAFARALRLVAYARGVALETRLDSVRATIAERPERIGLRMAVLRALDEAGIEIPFPQRDLHIRYAPDGAGPAAALKT